MNRPKLNFKGLMVPVFTCFNDNDDKSINTTIIDEYAVYLLKNGIKGVLVNGTTGEGPVLSVAERKLITEIWSKVCKKYDITLMVQIGGAPLTDVIELAKHSAELKVDAILCLPELYFKPKIISNLIGYLKQISQYCPDVPFLYYHIPMFTGINFHMPTFCDQAELEISNFVGLKYTSGDLEQGIDCLKENRNVFLGADTILAGALVLGFDSAIMTTLNLYPEISFRIIQYIEIGQISVARLAQQELNSRIKEILKNDNGEWVSSMKKAFNSLTSIQAGPIRHIY